MFMGLHGAIVSFDSLEEVYLRRVFCPSRRKQSLLGVEIGARNGLFGLYFFGVEVSEGMIRYPFGGLS